MKKNIETLLTIDSNEDMIGHLKQMLSFRFLGEVDKLCEQRKISRRDLAVMLGVSTNYVQQLFNGKRLVSFTVLARMEEALEVVFVVRLQPISPAA